MVIPRVICTSAERPSPSHSIPSWTSRSRAAASPGLGPCTRTAGRPRLLRPRGGRGLLGLGDLAAPLAVAGGMRDAVGVCGLRHTIAEARDAAKRRQVGICSPPAGPERREGDITGPIGPPEAAQPQGGVGMTWGSSDPTVWKGQGPAAGPQGLVLQRFPSRPPQCPDPSRRPSRRLTTAALRTRPRGTAPHSDGYPWGRKV